MRLSSPLVILPLLAVVSCDCARRASGLVCDERTKRSISSATIKDAAGFHLGSITVTDQVGRYEYHDISGGLFSCPPLRLAITAPGYITETVKFTSFGEQDTVFLKRPAP